MISVTRLNGSVIHLNAELISTVEAHHDTVITLVDGKTCVVKDSADAVVAKVITYRALVIAQAEQLITERVREEDEQDLPAANSVDVRPAAAQGPHLVVLRPADYSARR
jgi:uncharacterized protein YlzI (FlbEa/FlbD family)